MESRTITAAKNLLQHKNIIFRLTERELKNRYVGSALGIFWTFASPVSQILIYLLIFSVIFKVDVRASADPGGFAHWMIIGLLPWFLFSDVLTKAPFVLLGNANIITNMAFPAEILPAVNLLTATADHLLSLCVYVLIFVASGMEVSWRLLAILPVYIALSLLTLGLSWIFAALNVFLRDIGALCGIFVRIWFFLTPILYPLHLVPERLRSIYLLNPAIYFIEGYRFAFLGQSSVTMASMMLFGLASLAFFSAGAVLFKKLEIHFADVL